MRILSSFSPKYPMRFAAVMILVILVSASFLAPWLAPHDPVIQDVDHILNTPSGSHWLGTDDTGRDIFSRLLWGGRTSLLAAVQAVIIALLIGIPMGLLAGSSKGLLDDLIMRTVDGIVAVPSIVLAITIIGIVGGGIYTAMTAVGIIYSPMIARLARADVLSARSNVYVEAARSMGCSRARIALIHVLPNSLRSVTVASALLLGEALIAEATLGFLGFGVDPPTPSWGSMLGRAYSTIFQAGWQLVIPGLAITLAALAFNIVADGLSHALDPKSKASALVSK